MKTIILSSTGKVGSQLVQNLVQKQHDVLAVTRNSEKVSDFENLEYINPNVDQLEKTLKGADYLFLASVPLDDKAAEHLQPWIEAAKKENIKHLVFLSAVGVDEDPTSPLRHVEIAVEESGIPYTFLRPNFFLENFYPGFIYDTIKETGSIILPANDEKTSFISVEDIALFAANVFGQKDALGQGYTLTGASALSHTEIAERISVASGNSISYINVSADAWLGELEKAGVPEPQREYLNGLYQSVRDGYTGGVSEDISKWLGRSPISAEEYAEKYKAVWR